MEQLLEGVFTALITPFNKDGSVDYGALRNHVEWQIQEGIHGLVPTGTTGESPTLSHKEHSEVVRTVVKQSAGRVPVIAGTGSNSTQEAIELTKTAKDLGATLSLQVCPYYNKPSQEGLYRHFSTIAEQVDLPQIIYNIPGRTGKLIEIETMKKIIDLPNVRGVKEATGNVAYSIALLHLKKNISVFSGDDALLLSIMAQGGHGVISVLSNLLPAHMSSLFESLRNKDLEEAQEKYYNLYPLMNAMFIDTNPIPIKFACSVIGKCKEHYRLPLCELSQEHKNQLHILLREIKLL